MSSSLHRALAPALLVAAIAAAGCDAASVVGGVPGFDAGATDLGPIGLGDAPALDGPKDVADAGPPRCASNADCAGNAAGAVCDTATGRCVRCVASNDTCPADQHCDPSSNQCVAGCRADEGCAMATVDGGVSADGGSVTAGRCNVMTRACQECVEDSHCPSGTVCTGGRCAVGCTSDARCAAGQRCCAGACVDPQSNTEHCGACGTACSFANAAPACAAGQCAIGTCAAPFGDCDGMGANGCETNTLTAVAHCGGCGMACAARPNTAASCDAGACRYACDEGFADCDMDPSNGCEVDTRTSTSHCGACGTACSAANGTPSCAAGVCGVSTCGEGFANCDGMSGNGCEVNLNSSTAHCGACDRACPDRANAATICAAGACRFACNAGFADCDEDPSNGCETDLNTSLSHCGVCGRVCNPANGVAACVAGACGVSSCNAGFANCDGAGANGCETDTRTSTSHCGACNNACVAANGAPVCAAGSCGVGACNPGFANCDGMAANGCEVNTLTSTAHCGACNNACAAANGTPSCVAGACGVAGCNAGFGNCDNNAANGCEVNTQTTAAHCGACGAVCAPANAAPACAGGACGIASCNAGFGNCDNNAANGCEVNTQTSNAHCGACNRACGANQACVSGVCVGQGSLRFTLTWDTNGDMDLHLLPPCGTEIYYSRTSACGGTLDRDDTSARGPENIFWESSYTPGRYYVCPEAYSSSVANATYTLVVVRNGVEVHRSTGRRGRTDGNTPCSASFPGVVALDL